MPLLLVLFLLGGTVCWYRSLRLYRDDLLFGTAATFNFFIGEKRKFRELIQTRSVLTELQDTRVL